jgi:hypothetical protein
MGTIGFAYLLVLYFGESSFCAVFASLPKILLELVLPSSSKGTMMDEQASVEVRFVPFNSSEMASKTNGHLQCQSCFEEFSNAKELRSHVAAFQVRCAQHARHPQSDGLAAGNATLTSQAARSSSTFA